MKLSIVIVTWNSASDIETCIDSISFTQKFEVVVVDNASADSTREKLAQYRHLKVIANDRNLGYARANNQGIHSSSGEYVLLLNPDTKIELGALDVLTDWLDTHPQAGAAAPRLLNFDGTTQLSIRSFPTPVLVLWDLIGLARLFPRSRSFGRWRLAYFDYDKPAQVEQPMASCLMLRRTVLDQLGGLDERFPVFCNDVDLSKRMADSGWQTWYVPAARVFHRRGASTSQVRPKMIWESHRSLFRYLAKHDRSGFFWLKAIVLLPLLELVALVRVLWYRLTARNK
ncbi:MAG: glycosyltransferase family 2 protein [candidate division WOR-3 bacterium]